MNSNEGLPFPVWAEFQFDGNVTEYFKIWIVNVLLTIATLGIYSAWAKVRTESYFYGNTKVNGSSFRYTAEPLKILKGASYRSSYLRFSGSYLIFTLTSLFGPLGPQSLHSHLSSSPRRRFAFETLCTAT